MSAAQARRRADLLNGLRVLIRRCRIKAALKTSRDNGLELRVRHTLRSTELTVAAFPRPVNELANHRGQQICFDIAAIDGHYARVVRAFEHNSLPAFARPRDRQASPKYAGMSAHAYLAV